MNDIKVRHQEILENATYTPCEVAALLKIEMETVYRHLRDSTIPYFVIDPTQKRPRKRIMGSDLLAWIDQNKTT